VRYYQQVLRDTETLAFACRMHWIVFLRAIALLALALLLLVVSTGMTGAVYQLVLYAGLVCLVIAALAAVTAWMSWLSTEIAVTDRRVIYKHGLISRRTIEMNVSKIETVDVIQGPLARLLGYGDVIIRGTGGTFEPLRKVAGPIPLRNAILVG
jgi:uncharacterized membrane protein YdbT with pleckstrin-like domain